MPFELLQPEILRRHQLQHIEMGFDQSDRRHKQLPVEPISIEPCRWHVGRRHHHHLALKQALEQPTKDHRVGDVGDMQLVEAQQPADVGDVVCDARDRIAFH